MTFASLAYIGHLEKQKLKINGDEFSEGVKPKSVSKKVERVIEIAGKVLSHGADGLSLINTLRGMAVDIYKRRSRIARDSGGLSGPAIRPIAVRMVHECRQAVKIPILGMGGIFKEPVVMTMACGQTIARLTTKVTVATPLMTPLLAFWDTSPPALPPLVRTLALENAPDMVPRFVMTKPAAFTKLPEKVPPTTPKFWIVPWFVPISAARLLPFHPVVESKRVTYGFRTAWPKPFNVPKKSCMA